MPSDRDGKRAGRAALARRRRCSEALARAVEAWQKRLAPELPGIDPHDLHLILWSFLRRRYGGGRRFLLRRRKGGGYEF